MDTSAILIFVVKLLSFYRWVLIARILLSWIPSLDWYKQPFKFLNDITEPVLAPFRMIIPPLGGLDVSPILLFFLLNWIIGVLSAMAAGGGLPF